MIPLLLGAILAYHPPALPQRRPLLSIWVDFYVGPQRSRLWYP